MWYVWRFSMFNNSSDFKKNQKLFYVFEICWIFCELFIIQNTYFYISFSELNFFRHWTHFIILFIFFLFSSFENIRKYVTIYLPNNFATIFYSIFVKLFTFLYSILFLFLFLVSSICWWCMLFSIFLILYEYLLRFQQKKNRILLYSRTFIFIQFLFIYFHSAIFCRVVDVKLYCYGFRCKTNFWQHFNIK